MINKKIKAAYFIITVFLTLGLSISLQNLLAVWESPTENPPAGDVEAPLNTGLENQAKLGNLSLAGNFVVWDGLSAESAMLVESATGDVTVAGNIKADPPLVAEDVATMGWVEAQGVGGGEIVDPDRPGVGSASAGFDSHGGNFVQLSTATHNGNFGGKRAADNWCKNSTLSGVENADHMCNSWELHGVGAGAGSFFYQITRIGDSSFITKEGRRIDLENLPADIPASHWNSHTDFSLDCSSWTSTNGRGPNPYTSPYSSCGNSLQVACCSDYSDTPEIIVMPGTLNLTQTPQTPDVSLSWTAVGGAQGYKIRRDGSLIHTINSGGTTNYDTSVPSYSTYEFRVTPINPDGSESTASTSNTIALTCTPDTNNIGSPDGEDNDCDTTVDDSHTRINGRNHTTGYFAVNTQYSCPSDPIGGFDYISLNNVDLIYHIDTNGGAPGNCGPPHAGYCQGKILTEPNPGNVLASSPLWWSANCGHGTWNLTTGCHQRTDDGSWYYSYGEARAFCEYNVRIYDYNGSTRQ